LDNEEIVSLFDAPVSVIDDFTKSERKHEKTKYKSEQMLTKKKCILWALNEQNYTEIRHTNNKQSQQS
jgi:hypothetical protein